MGPTWGTPGSCRPMVDPMLAPWTLLSGYIWYVVHFRSRLQLYFKVHYSYRRKTDHAGNCPNSARFISGISKRLGPQIDGLPNAARTVAFHDDFTTWKRFPHYWPFMRWILSYQLAVLRFWWHHIEGVLPKGPYLPCVSMAGRALLEGYHRYDKGHDNFPGPIDSMGGIFFN